MKFLREEMIDSIEGIVYFNNEKEEIYATLNTFSNLYSYMEDLPQDVQEFFNDLARDTKDEDDVSFYLVKDELVEKVDQFLSSKFQRTNRYDWIEEVDEEKMKGN